MVVKSHLSRSLNLLIVVLLLTGSVALSWPRPIAAQTLTTATSYTFDWPVGKPRGAGWGVYGNTFLQWADNGQGKYQYHQGIDISMGPTRTAGKPVYAAYGGTVVYIYSGACIILKHNVGGRTVWTQYKHVQPYHVKKDQKVSKGQQIATINNDGIHSHLHFEVAYSTQPICGYVVGKSCKWVTEHYLNPFNWIGTSGGKTWVASCP